MISSVTIETKPTGRLVEIDQLLNVMESKKVSFVELFSLLELELLQLFLNVFFHAPSFLFHANFVFHFFVVFLPIFFLLHSIRVSCVRFYCA